MSYDRRRMKLILCDCITGINSSGECVSYPEKTLHCENSDGEMRCEICGRIK